MVTVNSKVFVRAIKSVSRFVGEDKTRPHMMVIRLEKHGDALLFVATNGAACGVFTLNLGENDGSSWSMQIPFGLVKPVIASIKEKTVRIEPVSRVLDFGPGNTLHVPVQSEAYLFPPWRQVMPAPGHVKAVSSLGLDLAIVADVAASFQDASRADGKRGKEPLHMVMETTGESGPIRFSVRGCPLVCVMMPNRYTSAYAAEWGFPGQKPIA